MSEAEGIHDPSYRKGQHDTLEWLREKLGEPNLPTLTACGKRIADLRARLAEVEAERDTLRKVIDRIGGGASASLSDERLYPEGGDPTREHLELANWVMAECLGVLMHPAPIELRQRMDRARLDAAEVRVAEVEGDGHPTAGVPLPDHMRRSPEDMTRHLVDRCAALARENRRLREACEEAVWVSDRLRTDAKGRQSDYLKAADGTAIRATMDKARAALAPAAVEQDGVREGKQP